MLPYCVGVCVDAAAWRRRRAKRPLQRHSLWTTGDATATTTTITIRCVSRVVVVYVRMMIVVLCCRRTTARVRSRRSRGALSTAIRRRRRLARDRACAVSSVFALVQVQPSGATHVRRVARSYSSFVAHSTHAVESSWSGKSDGGWSGRGMGDASKAQQSSTVAALRELEEIKRYMHSHTMER